MSGMTEVELQELGDRLRAQARATADAWISDGRPANADAIEVQLWQMAANKASLRDSEAIADAYRRRYGYPGPMARLMVPGAPLP